MAQRTPGELAPEQRRPQAITGYRERRELEIVWHDGHTTTHDWEYLRWQCPCATCRGEGGVPGMLASLTELSPEQTALEGIEQTGHYAITLIWADGHGTGIYTFEYLRRLCRCPECQAFHTQARPNG